MDEHERERLVRLEERVSNLQTNLKELRVTLAKLSNDIHRAELTSSSNSLNISKGERLFWLIISGIVGAILYVIRERVG